MSIEDPYTSARFFPTEPRSGNTVCSIIIPLYNRLELTRQCLDALRVNTDGPEYELILVENGSTDGTKEYLASQYGIKTITNETNLGFARACNQGARSAAGNFLVFLNNDTIPLKGWLKALVEVFEKYPTAGAAGSKLLYPDGTIQHAGLIFRGDRLAGHIYRGKPADHPAVNKLREFQAVTGACLAVPRELFHNVGGFDEQYLNGWEDVDFCLKLREVGRSVYYAPASTVYHLESKTQGRFDNVAANRRLFLDRWGAKIMPDEFEYYRTDGAIDEFIKENYKIVQNCLTKKQYGQARSVLEYILVHVPDFQPARKHLGNLEILENKTVDKIRPLVPADRSVKPVLSLHIIAYSDFEKDPQRRLRWGDYWVKQELAAAFEARGVRMDPTRPDAILHLFGTPIQGLPEQLHKIVWLHSHPDWITPELLKQYDKVYCLSPSFTGKIRSWGIDAETLIGGTSKKICRPKARKYDVVFVGNTKGPEARKIVRDLLPTSYKLKVWGEGWQKLLSAKYYAGLYYDNRKLPELYASSGLVLNDHWEDMRQQGFLNPRILDVFASGGLVVSDRLADSSDIFGNALPMYDTAEELREIVASFLEDKRRRREAIELGRESVMNYTFDKMAEIILADLEIGCKPAAQASLTVGWKK